jgi:hypothetical protein
MQVEKALKELNEYGFHIVQIEADKFMCYDTGLFGFVSDEDPFIVDLKKVTKRLGSESEKCLSLYKLKNKGYEIKWRFIE